MIKIEDNKPGMALSIFRAAVFYIVAILLMVAITGFLPADMIQAVRATLMASISTGFGYVVGLIVGANPHEVL